MVKMYAHGVKDAFELKLEEDKLPRTATGKLVRIGAICNDDAGWQLAATQLQSRILNIIEAETLPEPTPKYQIARIIHTWYVLELESDGHLIEYAEARSEDGAKRMAKLLNDQEEAKR